MKIAAFALITSLTIGNAAAADAPKNPCHKPEVPNRLASDVEKNTFNGHMKMYKKCVDRFVMEQRAFIAGTTDRAAAAEAHDAAEAAIVELNEQIKAIKVLNGDEP